MAGSRPRVVIVGAGLAGLACAADLALAGAGVTVLEAGDGPGGRVRTDLVNGFLLDRGFQVFNTSYPQVKRRFRLRELELCPFVPGALLHTAEGRVRFADPTRQPAGVADALRGRLGGPRGLAGLALLSGRDLVEPPSRIIAGPDRTTREALAAAGVSDVLVERLLRPFLSGVFLEDELETSSRFFHLVWRSMLRGSLGLPRRGMQAVSDQLAAGLAPGTVRLESPVRALTDDGAELTDGTLVPADVVVVATGPAAAAELLPGLEMPATRSVTTLYHAAPVTPLAEPVLLVDSERKVLNTCVLTEVSASYGPAGRALISTSVLGAADSPSVEAAVRARLAVLYDTDTSGWEHLASYPITGALPAMLPPWPLTRPAGAGPGRYVCGDYRATGSVQGALASGARAAREVLAGLP